MKKKFAIDEKAFENQEGLKIKIIFSNLGRRYKKIGNSLNLMLEKESSKIEDSLTSMTRLARENDEIDKKNEINIIKEQARQEIKKIEETKNDRIIALENELNILKELYARKQKEKELENNLKTEIENLKEKLQIEEPAGETEKFNIDNILNFSVIFVIFVFIFVIFVFIFVIFVFIPLF